jgi:hypothetical protein
MHAPLKQLGFDILLNADNIPGKIVDWTKHQELFYMPLQYPYLPRYYQRTSSQWVCLYVNQLCLPTLSTDHCKHVRPRFISMPIFGTIFQLQHSQHVKFITHADSFGHSHSAHYGQIFMFGSSRRVLCFFIDPVCLRRSLALWVNSSFSYSFCAFECSTDADNSE